MIPSIDLKTVRFDEPQYLWLLVVPAVLLVLWFWQAARRRSDARQLAHRRLMPVRERFQLFGGLLFWLCLVLASTSTIIALARPLARVSLIRTAGIDLVILQDGSTSMRVTDVVGNRWQRSMRFLRQIGESISWRDDRLAMALFARISTPQVRLTKDPNTYFFFLDHLSEESPFRLEDDTSWDTNMELGVYWGLKLVDRDEQIHGKSPNAKAFVMWRWRGRAASRSTPSASAPATAASFRNRHGPPPADRRSCRSMRFSIAPRSAPSPMRAAESTSSSIENPIARSPTRSSKPPEAGPAFRAFKRALNRSTGASSFSPPS
jgi:hypothetical protein